MSKYNLEEINNMNKSIISTAMAAMKQQQKVS